MTKYKNKIKCKNCGRILESKHRHDYQECPCGCGVAIDGGLDYCKRSYPNGNPEDWIEEIIEPIEQYKY